MLTASSTTVVLNQVKNQENPVEPESVQGRLLEHANEIRQAIHQYVIKKEGESYSGKATFDYNYAMKSPYIPNMRKDDIKEIVSWLDRIKKDDETPAFEDADALAEKVHGYLQTILTGWDVYFFRLGNGSELRDSIYEVLKKQNPILFVIDNWKNVYEKYKEITKQKHEARKTSLETQGEIREQKERLSQGEVKIRELTDALKLSESLRQEGITEYITKNSTVTNLQLKINLLIERVEKLTTELSKLDGELASKNCTIERLKLVAKNNKSASTPPNSPTSSVLTMKMRYF